MDRTRLKNIARLVVPSAIGAALFLVPIPASGGQEILSGLVVSFLKGLFGEALVPALVMIVGASAVVTVWHHVHSISWIANHEKLNGVFSPSHFWTVVRVLGAVLMLVVYFSVGPEWLVGEDTGRNMLFTVIPTCAMWYLVGGVFLPFLTDYGFIDLFGAFFRKYARPLFRIPGCAMIDCLSSWLGSSVCGTYLTVSQYEKGFYTGREAVSIISCFSLLSVSFCSMIASMLNLGFQFAAFYGTIVIANIVCALILPRLWPICHMPDTYYEGSGKRIEEEVPADVTRGAWAVHCAMKRAAEAPSVGATLAKGALNALDMILSTLPSIMTFGTVALVLAMHTDLFTYISLPLVPYLKLCGIPEAATVGSTILVGFADQFATVILGTTIGSASLRFLIGCLSILQILYMTDIGSLILTSKVPFRFWQIFIVYLERILICIPVVRFCAFAFGIA